MFFFIMIIILEILHAIEVNLLSELHKTASFANGAVLLKLQNNNFYFVDTSIIYTSSNLEIMGSYNNITFKKNVSSNDSFFFYLKNGSFLFSKINFETSEQFLENIDEYFYFENAIFVRFMVV